MRSYGRRIADRAIYGRIARRREISEGILWTVDPVSETCTVKIQGSNEQIKAHYPRNLTSVPSWLRVGNAVKIVHKNGARDYNEVTGPGRAIPNPITGEQFPGVSTLPDAVLTSAKVRTQSEGGYTLLISADIQYRIDGVTYQLIGNYQPFDPFFPWLVGDYPFTPLGQQLVTLGAEPSEGLFRYDILVAGVDGLVDVVSGSAATDNPSLPNTPGDHVFLAHVLRVGGETGTYNKRIGQIWTTPEANSLTIVNELDIAWDFLDNYPEYDIKMSVFDQYDKPIGNPSGWQFQCDMIFGTGQIYSDDSGYQTESVTQITTGSYYTFKYQRNQGLQVESSPVYMFYLNIEPKLTSMSNMRMTDAEGDGV